MAEIKDLGSFQENPDPSALIPIQSPTGQTERTSIERLRAPLQSLISSLTTSLNSLGNAVSGFGGRIDAIEGTIGSLNNTSLTSRVDAIEQDVSAIDTSLADAIADISGLDTAITGKISTTEKGASNGVATLGEDGKVPSNQLPTLSTGGSGSSLATWSVKSSDYTAQPGDRLRVNASAGNVVISLPPSPSPTDGEIWVQRVDTSGNSVILRSSAKFQGLSGKDALVNDRRVEVVNFVDTSTGWLSYHDRLSYRASPGNELNLNYVSNGDTNGLFFNLGTNGGSTSFTNPATNGRVLVLASSIGMGSPTSLSDRSASDFYTNDIPGSWIAWDLGTNAAFQLTRYSYRTRSASNGNHPRSWKIQGTNTINAWDTAVINSSNWVDLDTRVNQTQVTGLNAWFNFVLPSTVDTYRYIRMLNTGVTDTNQNFLCAGEIEFYGKLY